MISAKYRMLYLLSFRHALRNGKALVGLSLFLITCLVIFAHLWKAAATRIGQHALDPTLLLWYIAFNEWILISLPDVHEDIEHDLHIGRLAYLLPRPLSYLGATAAEAGGRLTAHLLILGTITCGFTWFYSGVFPFSPLQFLCLVGLGLLSALLALILQLCVGLSAFWLREVAPTYWIFEKLLFVLGGLLLPLLTYPEWMQTLARFTPFPSILGDRSALVFETDLGTYLLVFIRLLEWLAAALCLLFFLYKRALRIVNVEGG